MNNDGRCTRYARLNFIYLFLFSDYTHETAAATNEEDYHSCQRRQQGRRIRQQLLLQLPACQRGRQRRLPTPTKTTLAAPAAADANRQAYKHDINSNGRHMRYTSLNFIYFYFLTTPTKLLPPPTRRTTTGASAPTRMTTTTTAVNTNEDKRWLHLQLQTPTRMTLMGTTTSKRETDGIQPTLPSVSRFKDNIVIFYYFILVNILYI